MRKRNKGKRLETFVDNYVVFDLETTSNKIYEAKIVEIAAIKVRNGEVVDEIQWLINPEKSIPAAATSVNHITNEMVENAPIFEEKIDEFLGFVKGEILVGHNITTFDLNILYDEIRYHKGLKFDNDFVDTLYLARKCVAGLENYKLETISKHYDLDVTGEHRALKDCYLTNECYRRFDEEVKEHGFLCEKRTSQSRQHTNMFSGETKALQQLQAFLIEIVADNVLTEEEILKLNDWVEANENLRGNYPFDRVFEALENVLDDGIIEQEERNDLLVLFKEFISPIENIEAICIDTLSEKHCCLTGDFACGSKKEVEELITCKGGICDNTVKKTTDYVIVGENGSEKWKQGTYGSKIKKAKELQEKGNLIQIVSERDFIRELNSISADNDTKQTEGDTIFQFIDILEEDELWKKELQKMLDELIEKWELPEKSLFLAQNIGRVSHKITSYSVCIYEPEYPKIPNRKIDQSRNSVVMNIREKKDKLDLVIPVGQYNSVDHSVGLECKQLKSDPNNIHVIIRKNDDALSEFVKCHTEYRIEHYSSKASTFGCCSKFIQCSDARKCLHENRLYSKACSYRIHLDAGEIFYGKNRNID